MASKELDMILKIDTSEVDERLQRTIGLVRDLRECVKELAEMFRQVGESLRLEERKP